MGDLQSEAQSLIVDLGVSEGNDTAFYLSKGFRVIAVEADPDMAGRLRIRFAEQIGQGLLTLLNCAASESVGEPVKMYFHRVHQGLSGKNKRPDVKDDYVEHMIPTIDWETLIDGHPTPRYVKIDIEGNEVPFLRGMLRSTIRPEFISAECYHYQVIEMLGRLGYSRFKLVDQKAGFRLPVPQLEGRVVENAIFHHTSGPFGLDVFGTGNWLDAEGVASAWGEAKERLNRTWFDCHAWMPSDSRAMKL